MLFPTWCRNLTPLFDGEVVHVLHAVGGGSLEGEVVLVLHAVGAGHIEDTEVEALLDDTLEDEVTRVVSAEGAGRVVDTEAEELLDSALEDLVHRNVVVVITDILGLGIAFSIRPIGFVFLLLIGQLGTS